MNDKNKKTVVRMDQRYFIDSWLLSCSLRSHHKTNPTPNNGVSHFLAVPTHHPKQAFQDKENRIRITKFFSDE